MLNYGRVEPGVFVALDDNEVQTVYMVMPDTFKHFTLAKESEQVKSIVMTAINENPVKSHIFEGAIPKRLNATQHFNVSMYLSAIGDKNKKI